MGGGGGGGGREREKGSKSVTAKIPKIISIKVMCILSMEATLLFFLPSFSVGVNS